MEKTTTITCGGDLFPFLSEDVLIRKVLVCLPVKSLLRFKSVCKSWREIIQTPFFIDLHTTFNNSSSNKFGDTFIIQTTGPASNRYKDDIKLYKLSSGDGDGGGTGEGDDNKDDQKKKKKKMVFKLDEDFGFLQFYKDTQLSDTLRMVGSCNGIICLHDPKLMDVSKGRRQQDYSNRRDVCLWNPATRQFRILPKSILIEEKKYYMNWLEDFIAFGFDVKTKDYKVLRINPWKQSKEEGCMCRAQVYSLSTDSWRLLEGINSLPVLPNSSESSSGIYLNGSYFFAVRNFCMGGAVMLSFDFTQEIFTTMPLPSCETIVSSFLGKKWVAIMATHTIVSSYLGDKLVAIFATPHYDRDSGYDLYDIWVLNEQHCGGGGVSKESWTKLHSFQIKISSAIFLNQLRCISNNGEFALISCEFNDGRTSKLQLFNLVTKEAIKDFTVGNGKCRVGVVVYKESLVSIMGGGGNVFLGGSSQPTHVPTAEG